MIVALLFGVIPSSFIFPIYPVALSKFLILMSQ
jgi:hypothetical protein